jgi:hypothetical protein
MVLFFEASHGYTIFMGADKYENEDLIKYGVPEDIWFHVDDMSSAHVYLRLNKDQRLEDLPEEVLQDCVQLVKANSIEGCKLKEVFVVYTRWKNLNKTSSMEVGAIGYHDSSKVKRIKVVKDQSIVNRLTKTKREAFPDLAKIQEERARLYRQEVKEMKKQQIVNEKKEKFEREEKKKLINYSSVMVSEKMVSNTEFTATVDDKAAKSYEDDFM